MRASTLAAGFLVGALFWIVLAALVAGVYVLLSIVGPAIANGSSGSSSGLSSSTIAFWDRVAQCETGSTWTGLGSTYQGGLGIYSSTWDWWAGELGLDRRYPDAGDAPRLVQIRVADYGRRVHNGGWGCIR